MGVSSSLIPAYLQENNDDYVPPLSKNHVKPEIVKNSNKCSDDDEYLNEKIKILNYIKKNKKKTRVNYYSEHKKKNKFITLILKPNLKFTSIFVNGIEILKVTDIELSIENIKKLRCIFNTKYLAEDFFKFYYHINTKIERVSKNNIFHFFNLEITSYHHDMVFLREKMKFITNMQNEYIKTRELYNNSNGWFEAFVGDKTESILINQKISSGSFRRITLPNKNDYYMNNGKSESILIDHKNTSHKNSTSGHENILNYFLFPYKNKIEIQENDIKLYKDLIGKYYFFYKENPFDFILSTKNSEERTLETEKFKVYFHEREIIDTIEKQRTKVLKDVRFLDTENSNIKIICDDEGINNYISKINQFLMEKKINQYNIEKNTDIIDEIGKLDTLNITFKIEYLSIISKIFLLE